MDRSRVVRVLGLFSGIGGLERGVTAGLGDVGLDAQCVGMVEGEAFGAGCLEAAMRRGDLAPAPVWLGDIREFPAADFGGAVDLVVAGFPCQPASAAGKRKGTGDERWLWPEVVRVVRESRAPLVFLENVRGLLNVNRGGAFAEVLQGLADLGFDAEWTLLPAAAVGAPHRRERVFVLGWRRVADAGSAGGRWTTEAESGRNGPDDGVPRENRGSVDNAASARRDGTRERADADGSGGECLLGTGCEVVADSRRPGDERRDDTGGVGPVQVGVEGEARERERERSRDDAGHGVEALADADHRRRTPLLDTGGGEAATGGGEDDAIEDRGGGALADGGRERLEGIAPAGAAPRSTGRGDGAELADPDRGPGSPEPEQQQHGADLTGRGFPFRYPPGPGERGLWHRIIAADPGLAPAVESGVRGVDDGGATGLHEPRDVDVTDWRSHRLRALGNAVVAEQARAAFAGLWRRMIDG